MSNGHMNRGPRSNAWYVRSQGGYQVKPRYPELARRLGIQGTVLPNDLLSDKYVAISNIA
jgi:hypothetical protein